jgi:hypothetical protein
MSNLTQNGILIGKEAMQLERKHLNKNKKSFYNTE